MQRRALSLVLLVFVCAGSGWAEPKAWFDYKMKGGKFDGQDIVGFLDMTDIGDCAPRLLTGTIESVDFKHGLDVMEGFRVRTKDGNVEFIGITDDLYSKIAKADRGWLNKLVAPRRKVLASILLCGVSGRVVLARDIYDLGKIAACK